MPVRLDRRVRAAGADLQPGLYQLVLIEREGNQGELCFIARNKFREQRIAAVAPVKILSRGSDVAAIPVIYEEESGIATIAEIRMPTRTLRLKKPIYRSRGPADHSKSSLANSWQKWKTDCKGSPSSDT